MSPGYLIPRFLAFGNAAREAERLDPAGVWRFTVVLPLMIIHYGIGYGAMGSTSGLASVMLMLASLLMSCFSPS
jgi:hypothetical protein